MFSLAIYNPKNPFLVNQFVRAPKRLTDPAIDVDACDKSLSVRSFINAAERVHGKKKIGNGLPYA